MDMVYSGFEQPNLMLASAIATERMGLMRYSAKASMAQPKTLYWFQNRFCWFQAGQQGLVGRTDIAKVVHGLCSRSGPTFLRQEERIPGLSTVSPFRNLPFHSKKPPKMIRNWMNAICKPSMTVWFRPNGLLLSEDVRNCFLFRSAHPRRPRCLQHAA
jgi:hypothetical protein